MATDDGLRYVDSDGHILEHPTAMPDYAPAEYRDRIWHIETDDDGEEWLLYNGNRTPANGMSAAGVAGASDEDRARAFRGEMRYTETRPGGVEREGPPPGHGPGPHRPRRPVPDDAARRSRASATSTSPRCRPARTTTGAPTTSRRARAVSSVRARCRPCTNRRTSSGSRRRSVGWPTLPGMVSVFMRPNPVIDWRPFNDPVYDPIWQAASDTGRADRAAPVPRRRPSRDVQGPAPEPAPHARRPVRRRLRPRPSRATPSSGASRLRPTNIFTQGIANPFDVMSEHRVPHRGRRVRAFPRREVHLPGGERWLAGPVAGAHRPPLPEVPVGGRRPVDAAVGVLPPAVLDQLRPRRGDAAA